MINSASRFLYAFITLVVLTGCTLTSAFNNADEVTLTGVPVVALVAPKTNAIYADGATINTLAQVSNAGEDVARVVVTLNGASAQIFTDPNPAGDKTFNVAQALESPGIGEHTLSVTAYRADNSASETQAVSFMVVDASTVTIPQGDPLVEPTTVPTEVTEPVVEAETNDEETNTVEDDSDVPEPEEEEEPDTPEPSLTPTATQPPTDTPEPTSSAPVAISTANINIRSGPSTLFEPPIGAFREGERAPIIALSTDRRWLRIRRDNGVDGWVFGNIVDIEGDIGGLPLEEGPPLPPTEIPPTNTPVATSPPALTNNLVPVSPFLDPPGPSCGQPFRAGITIRNDGTGTLSTGITRIEIIHVASGNVIATSGDALVSVDLPPDGQHRVAFDFDIDVFVDEEQRVRFIADANNSVRETIEDDNENGITYILTGPCQ
jgi:hypothetical protein